MCFRCPLALLAGAIFVVQSVSFGSAPAVPVEAERPEAVPESIAPRLRFQVSTPQRFTAAITPDGTRVAFVDGKTVRVRAIVGNMPPLDLVHVGAPFDVAISPDGRRVATAGHSRVQVWDAQTGERVVNLAPRISWATRVAYSPDGTQLLAGHSRGAIVWDTQSWEPQTEISAKAPMQWITGVAFSGDGARFVTGGRNRPVELWRPGEASPDRILASAGDSGAAVTTFTVSIAPDGAVASAEGLLPRRAGDFIPGVVRVREPDGRERYVLSGVNPFVAAFSSDGRFLATADTLHRVTVHDAATGRQRLRLAGHAETVFSVKFDRRGRRAVTAGADGQILVWDLPTVAAVEAPRPESQPRNAAADDRQDWWTFGRDAATGHLWMGNNSSSCRVARRGL